MTLEIAYLDESLDEQNVNRVEYVLFNLVYLTGDNSQYCSCVVASVFDRESESARIAPNKNGIVRDRKQRDRCASTARKRFVGNRTIAG